jgi:hypothetical protein
MKTINFNTLVKKSIFIGNAVFTRISQCSLNRRNKNIFKHFWLLEIYQDTAAVLRPFIANNYEKKA